MTRPHRFSYGVRALLVGLLTLVLVGFCAAQRHQAGSHLRPLGLAHRIPAPYSQRTDAFRRLLFEFHFTSLAQKGEREQDSFGRLYANPRETLLIVLGDPCCLSKAYFPAGLRWFVEHGGAVLIATDKKVEGDAKTNLAEVAGVFTTGEILACRTPNPVDLYEGNPHCPFVQPIPDSRKLMGSTNVLGALAAVMGAGGGPVLFRNPRPKEPDLRVATNAPSRLQVDGWGWLPRGIHRLARLPLFCQEEDFFPGQFPYNVSSEQREGSLFAVGGTVGEGRVLVLADHSIFINRMMLPRDTGNLEFTANILHWLRGGTLSTTDLVKAANDPRGLQQLTSQRDKALFWDDGQICTNFEAPLKQGPFNPFDPSLVSEPAIVAAVDQTLARWEDENAFNRKLLEKLNGQAWNPQELGQIALYALTLVVFLFLVYRFVWHGRHRLDTAVPLLARVVTQHVPRTSLLEQRRQAVLQAGNVWETAHQLARQCFESAGISLTGTSEPRIAVQGSWWRRWCLRRRVQRLWRLARGIAPSRVSPDVLQRWLGELEELKIALLNAEVRMQNAE